MDEVTIWPAFINSDLTRSQGRRLSRKLCTKSPKVEEMLEAARKLGIKARVGKKAFPRMWSVEKRVLILEQYVPRSRALRQISEQVRKARSE